MKTWIALLRGINVGGRNIVPMKELRKLLESNGFTNVKTYIQSGNVVLQSPEKPEGKIGQLIEETFGFQPAVFILSKADLMRAAANNPFQSDQGKTIHFFFLDREPDSIDKELLESMKSTTEEYRLIKKVFYLYAPDGIGRSKLAEKVGKVFPDITMTARNLNTIQKLMEMAT